MNKNKSLYLHARKRAYHRYGVRLSKTNLKEIIAMIQANNSVPVHDQFTSRNQHVHDINYAGIKMRVVYDKCRKAIVTFLPIR